jgi:hypothetical protein
MIRVGPSPCLRRAVLLRQLRPLRATLRRLLAQQVLHCLPRPGRLPPARVLRRQRQEDPQGTRSLFPRMCPWHPPVSLGRSHLRLLLLQRAQGFRHSRALPSVRPWFRQRTLQRAPIPRLELGRGRALIPLLEARPARIRRRAHAPRQVLSQRQGNTPRQPIPQRLTLEWLALPGCLAARRRVLLQRQANTLQGPIPWLELSLRPAPSTRPEGVLRRALIPWPEARPPLEHVLRRALIPWLGDRLLLRGVLLSTRLIPYRWVLRPMLPRQAMRRVLGLPRWRA